MHIVTLTSYADIHALLVDRALKSLAVDHSIWVVPNFPRLQSITASISAISGRDRVTVSDTTDLVPDRNIDVVWNRRPAMGNLFHKGNHPGDSKFIKQETSLFLRSIWLTYAPKALWINNPLSKFAADAKLWQLVLARQCGLTIPSTLASNDPSQVRPFIEENGGRVLHKSFHGHAWAVGENENPSIHVNFAATIGLEDLDPKSVEICPSLYQQYVEKKFDVRVVLCGKTLLAVKIDSQSDSETKIDFRLGQSYLPLAEYELPNVLQGQLLAFADLLDVSFGSFDLIVDGKGDHIFLEFNEQGQFLWMEFNNPELPVLHLILDFLVSADPQFRWRRPSKPIRLSSFADDRFWSDYETICQNLDYAELNTRQGQG